MANKLSGVWIPGRWNKNTGEVDLVFGYAFTNEVDCDKWISKSGKEGIVSYYQRIIR